MSSRIAIEFHDESSPLPFRHNAPELFIRNKRGIIRPRIIASSFLRFVSVTESILLESTERLYNESRLARDRDQRSSSFDVKSFRLFRDGGVASSENNSPFIYLARPGETSRRKRDSRRLRGAAAKFPLTRR